MIEPCVLVVGGRPQLVRKAREAGLRVVLVQQPDEYQVDQAHLVEDTILVDYTDWHLLRPLAIAAHERYGFRSAVSTTEPGLEPAGLINDQLGLAGTSFAVSHLLRDKWAMREHLASVGFDRVAAELVRERGSLLDFGRANGFPFIVKPADAAASLGVMLLAEEADIDRVWSEIMKLRGSTEHMFANYFPIERFLMEEYIQGPEYSVESFSFNGDHVIVAITEKQVSSDFVELGHALPARLDAADKDQIMLCVEKFLDAVGMRQGPGHTEVKMSSSGPRVIEGHNRTGGDRIPELVDAAYGLDLEAYTAAWPGGIWPALTGRQTPRAAAATRFLTSPPGKIKQIRGVADVQASEGVLDVEITVAVGDTVQPLKASWDRAGQILLTAVDTAEAVLAVALLADKIFIDTE